MVAAGGVELACERTGEGTPIVLAHGLSATRRYVTHGSRLLERSGFDVLAYDARGHGDSSPAPERSAYEYSDLVADLEAVLDSSGLDSAVLTGASMGAATALAFTLEHPERVRALVQITPAHFGMAQRNPAELARWDALADGLERDGVEGFMRAYGVPPVEERFRGLVMKAIRQRIERHRHPEAVAEALRVVPRSTAWEGGLEELEHLTVPALVVGSRNDLDPEHALSIAEAYAERLPNAELAVEEPGSSPLAWRGAQLSRAIMGFVERAGVSLRRPQIAAPARCPARGYAEQVFCPSRFLASRTYVLVNTHNFRDLGHAGCATGGARPRVRAAARAAPGSAPGRARLRDARCLRADRPGGRRGVERQAAAGAGASPGAAQARTPLREGGAPVPRARWPRSAALRSGGRDVVARSAPRAPQPAGRHDASGPSSPAPGGSHS